MSHDSLLLERPCFDRKGNLLFVEVFGGRIFRLTPDKELQTVLKENPLGSAGLAIHADGRIFVAGLGNFKDTGSLFWVTPDGSNLQTITPSDTGYLPDDLVSVH